MQLGQLLYPYKKFQSGGDTSMPEGFEELSNLRGIELERYLQNKFGVKDATGMSRYFDPYDTSREEALQRQHQIGMESAQMGAGQKMSDIFTKARQAGIKGGGFGGLGKGVQQAKGATLGALQQQKAKLGENLSSGLYSERQRFIDQFGSTVSGLGQYGAEFRTAEELSNLNTLQGDALEESLENLEIFEEQGSPVEICEANGGTWVQTGPSPRQGYCG